MLKLLPSLSFNWLKTTSAGWSWRQPACAAGVVACLLPLAALTGCKTEPAARDIRPLADDEANRRWIFEGSEQRRAQQALAELARDHQPVGAVARAEHGVRWSDVPLAAIYASDEAEMAIIAKEESETVCRYQLLTVEDWPATLTIRQAPPPQIYQAEATVGRFNDHPQRAAQLLTAFDQQMRDFGRKRQYQRR